MSDFYIKKIAVAFVVLGLSVVLFPTYGQATQKRQHDPEIVKTADMDRTVSREKKINELLAQLRKSHDLAAVPIKAPVAMPLQPYQENDAILGGPMATPEQCVKYLLKVNPSPNIKVSANELVEYYYEEGTREGVRPDVAFAQALKETGFFRYGGTVSPDQNNYCGLGTTSAQVKGAYFSSPLLGVRAHIQHLLAYASTKMPAEPVVDPRYDLVRSVYTDSPISTWEGLNGRWAVPGRTYGEDILQIHRGIVNEQ